MTNMLLWQIADKGSYYQLRPHYYYSNGWKAFGAVNFATGFTSAVYDQSFSWTIDPEMFDNYSTNYLRDEADFYVK